MSRIHHVAQGLERANGSEDKEMKVWKLVKNFWDCQFIVVDANCVGDTFCNWACSGSLIATKAANLPHLNYILKGQGHAARNEVLNQIPMLTMLRAMGEKTLLLQHIIG